MQNRRSLFTGFVTALVLTALSHCGGDRRIPQRWHIPNDYTGWIILEYNVAGAPALPIRDGYLVIQPGPSGRLQTSTEYSSGWAKDEFYYVNPESTVQLEKTAPGGGGLGWGASATFEQPTRASVSGSLSSSGLSKPTVPLGRKGCPNRDRDGLR